MAAGAAGLQQPTSLAHSASATVAVTPRKAAIRMMWASGVAGVSGGASWIASSASSLATMRRAARRRAALRSWQPVLIRMVRRPT